MAEDDETLKNIVVYCLYYFGASDDIFNLGLASYPDRSSMPPEDTEIKWHIGVGGYNSNSNSARYPLQEMAFLPPISDYKLVTKIFGLPPRTAFAANTLSNINLPNFTGSTKNIGYGGELLS